MTPIGYSTGALFRNELEAGVSAAKKMGLSAIELSALRTPELANLVEFAASTSLPTFEYVSVHAPIDYGEVEEADIAGKMFQVIKSRDWNVVVHPDSIFDFDVWRPFGSALCIENMDKRKGKGRTATELDAVFKQLPAASLCFDIAHAHQVDATMTEAYRILRLFQSRIKQVHMSSLTGSGKHARLSLSALHAYRLVLPYIPRETPVIVESPTSLQDAVDELQKVLVLFSEAEQPAEPGEQSDRAPGRCAPHTF